nr:primosomal protein N' [Clostridium sp. Marseille-P299]
MIQQEEKVVRSLQYADIIVDISSEHLDKTYQYSIPEELKSVAVIGAPVIIPFGKGNRTIKGYIVSLSETPKISIEYIKPIAAVEEKGIRIESQLIALAYYIKEQFGGTMNDALRTVIPVKKSVKHVEKKTVTLAVSREEAIESYKIASSKSHKAKARLLQELIDKMELDHEIVVNKLNISRSTIESLQKSGIIKVETKTLYRNPVIRENNHKKNIILNEEQKHIVSEILKDYKEGIRKTYLIHGKTGSGKTEVYLDIIEGVIAAGKQVIMLIPEIALTYQTVMRFYGRFGDRISIMNSRLSQGEKYDQSLRAKNGEVDIIIGPRSALFTPFKNLGLIIIDEEHEASYKSEMPPKYHAREVAIKRAELSNASVILGSATPSLESYSKAINEEFGLFKLHSRAKEAKLPTVHIIDLREELKNKNKSMFSNLLRELIKDRLEKRQQIMLFINRRGYAGFVSCRSCGHVLKCPHCDISLTSHNNGSLRCHYCGYEETMPKLCPVCGSRYIAAFGTGTQKVEEMVKREFPTARVLRMDADTTKQKNSHEEILATFASGDADILIGTQMIVKGHDFSGVTLVGILAADMSLYAGDYRAAERTFQLLAQAAGRAGRGELLGEVVIQTYQPEHYSIVSAAKEDYTSFYENEMNYRKLLKYPPAAHILVGLLLSKDEAKVKKASELFAGAARVYLESSLAAMNQSKEENELIVNSIIVGPTDASLAKANDIYRRVIYFKYENYESLVLLKDFLEGYIENSEYFEAVSVQFDFNPMSSY